MRDLCENIRQDYRELQRVVDLEHECSMLVRKESPLLWLENDFGCGLWWKTRKTI